MRRLAAILLPFALVGCAGMPLVSPPSCPAGQDYLHTAQLFFGRNADGPGAISETDFSKFVDEELTPRFPNGLTVLDGGARWGASGGPLIHDAQKVVLIVLPGRGDAPKRIEAVRGAYKARFHQDSVLQITQASCVSF